MRPRVKAAIAFTIVAGWLASGCSKASETSTDFTPVAAPDPSSSPRVIVSEQGFAPSSLTLPKGPGGANVPVTFLRTTDATCAKEVVFSDLGIKKDLPLNVPVTIVVPTDAARTLTFQCGMAMFKGALVVK